MCAERFPCGLHRAARRQYARRPKHRDRSDFTCADVQFTYNAVTKSKDSIVASQYKEIDSVDCPDPNTAVVKYKNFYAPYLTLFNSIFPKNAGAPEDMAKWAYNRKPN